LLRYWLPRYRCSRSRSYVRLRSFGFDSRLPTLLPDLRSRPFGSFRLRSFPLVCLPRLRSLFVVRSFVHLLRSRLVRCFLRLICVIRFRCCSLFYVPRCCCSFVAFSYIFARCYVVVVVVRCSVRSFHVPLFTLCVSFAFVWSLRLRSLRCRSTFSFVHGFLFSCRCYYVVYSF